MLKKITLLLLCTAATAVAVQAQYVQDSYAAKQTRRQRFDRGLGFDTKTPAMPKGLWVFGLNLSYSEHSNDDFRFLVIKDFNSTGSTFSISPMAHYVFANNQSIGLRLQYKRNALNLDKVSLDLGDLTDNTSIGPYQYLGHSYMGFISYRYYLGLGASKRFLLFNEVQAGIGGGQVKELSGEGSGSAFKNGTYQTNFDLKLGLMPGMIAFITNEVAVEVAVGLMGFNYKNIKQTTRTENGEVIDGGRKTSSISTKIDLLAISFGMTFYL